MTFNQIIKFLNQIIGENKPYNLHLCTLKLNFEIKITLLSENKLS